MSSRPPSSPVYTGILIQILIQIGYVYTYGGKLDSNPDSDHHSHVDCDPDSNPDSGPGVRVNAPSVSANLWNPPKGMCATGIFQNSTNFMHHKHSTN